MADLPQILEMGRELYLENSLMPLSESSTLEVITSAINGENGVIGVIGSIGHVEAMIHLTIGKFWYTESPHVEELYNYVRPEFRKSNNAKSLIEFAKDTAKKMGVPLLISILSNERTQTKIRLYERVLGKSAGAFFLYNGKTGS